MDIATFRKLVALDESDPLSRFGLGMKLAEEENSPEALTEAAEHLRFAKSHAPEHLATYHVLGQVLIRLGKFEEAKQVLREGCERAARVGEGMGRDLGPVMADMLASL